MCSSYSTLQHTATHCNTLHMSMEYLRMPMARLVNVTAHCPLQHTTTHCNTLQHTATHCKTLNVTAHCPLPTATHCSMCTAMSHTATHCNALQHTASHCTAVHHNETHCSALEHTAICIHDIYIYMYVFVMYIYVHTYKHFHVFVHRQTMQNKVQYSQIYAYTTKFMYNCVNTRLQIICTCLLRGSVRSKTSHL